MDGGGGSSDSTTTNEPWEGAQGSLRAIYRDANRAYNAGEFGQVAPQSPYTMQAQQGIADRALGGGFGVNTGAIDLANQTLGGDFLSQGNPYLQDAISYSQQPVIDAWNEQIAPGIDATFGGSAGGLGSGAYAAARNRGEDTLARNLAGAATQAGFQNYSDERGRMMQAMGLAPGLEQAGYAGFDRLGQVGAQQDARAQLEADSEFRAQQQRASLINSTPMFGTATTTQDQGGIDPWGAGLGTALTLGSLFACDKRLKMDINRVGSLDSGEGIYTYRYKGDESKTVHLGVMAQEIEANHPSAVHEVQGIKMVDYGALADAI